MAIEAKSFDEKDELVSKFYTIRAGLSVISEETQKLREADDKRTEIRRLYDGQKRRNDEKFRNDYEQYLSEKEWIDENEEKIRGRVNGRKKYFDNKKRKYAQTQNSIPKPYVKPSTYLKKGLLLGFVLWILIGGVLSAIFDDNDISFGNVMIEIIITLFIVFLSAVLSFTLTIKVCKRSAEKKELDSLWDEKKRDLSKQEYELKSAEKDLNEAVDELNKFQQRKAKLIEPRKEYYLLNEYTYELEFVEDKINNELAPPISEKCMAIKKSLNEQFGDIITEADWGNVDLLIFYLSTGRADNLKEALLLVDRQRQTDQIAFAIRDAANYISRSMSENTYKLASVISNCFSQLSTQIESNHRQMISRIENTNDQLQGLQEKVVNMSSRMGEEMNDLSSLLEKQFVNTQELHEALLAQSQKSSDDLINELRYNQSYWTK